MSDNEGDDSKKTEACRAGKHCPNLKEVGGGMEGERYRCDVCGKSYFLDYDEMR